VNRLPPRIVRRLVVAPIVLALCLFLVALFPAYLAASALAALAGDRRWRLLRITTFATVYAVYEFIGILAMLVLWLRALAGFRIRSPQIQEAHIRFMRWWLRGINRAAAALFNLRIHIEDKKAPEVGPVLVFSRHAGPGNSLMLVAEIMLAYNRRPRIVMLAKLQWDPFFDMIGNRLPNRFIQHDPARRDLYVRAIAELAEGIGEHDAFVLFPEGKDFTPKLRLRAIAHLRKGGHLEAAEKAERMARVLPPRPGGVTAAVGAAPHADVVFVAHTVLEDVGSFRELWHRIPLDRPVFARYWRIPAEEVPSERDELIDWLFHWWGRIDTWIAQRVAMVEEQAPRVSDKTEAIPPSSS
jgi:1-acyl-sn-glycerol-3-phosphate acyltransferase